MILQNDKTWDCVKYFYDPYSPGGAQTIIQYSDKPDEIETDGVSFVGHFYDPTTGLNYLGDSTPTALERLQIHALNAYNYYWINRTYALQELGMAIHYLTDLCEPHHASNKTALNSNHTTFETYADNNRVLYSVSFGGDYSNITYTSYFSYVTDKGISAAYNAYAYKDYALSVFQSNWDYALQNTLPYAQRVVAGFLYKFLKEVGENVP